MNELTTLHNQHFNEAFDDTEIIHNIEIKTAEITRVRSKKYKNFLKLMEKITFRDIKMHLQKLKR